MKATCEKRPHQRREQQRQQQHRGGERQSLQTDVAIACRVAQSCGVPVVRVTRALGLSERTVRRWRRPGQLRRRTRRGRPPRAASREERNLVYRFLKERGATTPLAALRAQFPQLRRAELDELLRRFRRVCRRRARRYQSRLEWRRAGTVWAADFKERREPMEGRYGWLLSIKDLGSGCQLAWEPLTDATAEAVRDVYRRLFIEHGPPLVLKTDNGGQFKADTTKELLDQWRVLPLYSPKRCPQYNGGVERANGQLAGYQEALAQFHRRPAGPTCDDAARARLLANELAHPQGWRGPTAGQLWEQRTPIGPSERDAFATAVEAHRASARAHWNFAPDESLDHYQAAAVDRRAIRDALVQQALLTIHSRRRRRKPANATPMASAAPPQPPPSSADTPTLAHTDAPARSHTDTPAQSGTDAPAQPASRGQERAPPITPAPQSACTIETQREQAPPTVGGAPDLRQRVLTLVRNLFRGGPFLRQ